MDDQTIGQNIAAIRNHHKLSQTELAKRMRELGNARWTQGTVSLVEVGGRALRLPEARDLASVLDVEMSAFLEDMETANLRVALLFADTLRMEAEDAIRDFGSARERALEMAAGGVPDDLQEDVDYIRATTFAAPRP